MTDRELNLLAAGVATGAYLVLIIWTLIAFWDDLWPTRIPVRSKD